MAKNKIFDGLSTFGRIDVYINSILGLFMCLIFFVSGIAFYTNPEKYKINDEYNIDETKKTGKISIVISVIVAIMIIVNIYFTRKYKTYAAVEGAMGGVHLIKGLFM